LVFNKNVLTRSLIAAIGIVLTVLQMTGCTMLPPEQKKPTSVREWMGSTKQVIPGEESKTEKSE
jgi:hypothetical protein